jgi:bacillithiol synthase
MSYFAHPIKNKQYMSLRFTKIPLVDIPFFAKTDVAYIREEATLRDFYKYPVELNQFAQVMADKAKDPVDRSLLVSVLTEQYALLSENELVLSNIRSLEKENCFTVVTAHQPVIFTGPLYYIYKILCTIKLAEVLRAHYPYQQFVPVFVSGAEDHDFEEVKSTIIFNTTLTWENQETGPVGKMSTTTLAPLLEELAKVLGNSAEAITMLSRIQSAYTKNATYGDATIELIHELFKAFGLVVIDMSHLKLKRAALPIFKEELLTSVSVDLVETAAKALSEKGFKTQASPRDINLFYLGPHYRERIVREGLVFKVINTDLEFSQEELLEELEKHPERFSPNVIMRPLYQELILPNLAYIGGGGEIAYWLERKAQFEHFGINFPMLIRRSSALILSTADHKKMEKLGLKISDLFRDPHELVRHFLKENTESHLELNKEKENLINLFQNIVMKAKAIDPTLEGAVKAEESKAVKSLEQLEARFVKAEKRNQEVKVSQINNLRERLFPTNALQERKINFLSFSLQLGETFFAEMKEALNPLEKQFVVFTENQDS